MTMDILHRIGVENSSPEAVYDALTTIEGLAGWWASDTTGTSDEVGGVIEFRFAPGGFDMAVRELVPGKAVRWEVVDGPDEWIGTEVSFDISPERRVHDRPVQARRLARTGRVHVPLQHQVGDLPDEPQAAAGDRSGSS